MPPTIEVDYTQEEEISDEDVIGDFSFMLGFYRERNLQLIATGPDNRQELPAPYVIDESLFTEDNNEFDDLFGKLNIGAAAA